VRDKTSVRTQDTEGFVLTTADFYRYVKQKRDSENNSSHTSYYQRYSRRLKVKNEYENYRRCEHVHNGSSRQSGPMDGRWRDRDDEGPKRVNANSVERTRSSAGARG